MKPKNELQKKVVELSAKLPSITEKQRAWGFEKLFDKHAVHSKKTTYCLECGHSWTDEETVFIKSIIGIDCPNCSQKLKLKQPYEPAFTDSAYYAILTTTEDMQVVRMFYLSKKLQRKHEAYYHASEVMQHWISPTGQIVTMSIGVRSFTMYYDQWIHGSEMEVRNKTGSYRCEMRHNIAPSAIYPWCRTAKTIRRNGFKGSFHGIAPHEFISMLLTYPMFETLLKAGQTSLMRYFAGPVYHKSKLKDAWPIIRICIRNQYKVKDVSMWFDYIQLLKHFGKDIMNPFYVCPSNLKKAHDKLVVKKRIADKKKEIAELREKIDMAQAKYRESKERFFDLAFDDGTISIRPLKTVEEFMQEGDELKHCVFTNAYYERDDSLILTARIGTKPIETIEVSLSQKSIQQARGFQNKASAYHDRIINIVQRNMFQIAKLTGYG